MEMGCKNSYTSSNTAYHFTIYPGPFAVAIDCGITSKEYNEIIANSSIFIYIMLCIYFVT
jgi:hypothetical protein